MRVHHVGLRHRPRRLRTTPWQVTRAARRIALEPDGEAPASAWMAFARQDDPRPAAHVPDLPAATPVINGRRAADS